MELELVSFNLCPFVHRVATLLHEKGVPFSLRYIDLKNKPDWFLALSPRGRVPVLVAGGQPLFESAAILEFVDETHAPPLLPADPFARARQRAFISFAGDVFMTQYRYQTAMSPEDLSTAHTALLAQLGTFEQALGEADYFGGASFGLVDAAMAPALLRLVLVERHAKVDAFGALDKVRRWSHRLAARASVERGLPPGFEALYVESLRSSKSALGQRIAA